MSSRPLRIFIAEDNPADIELVREALLEFEIDHELEIAMDGAEAKGHILSMGTAAKVPDLVLLDLNLPQADGHELFALFRSNPSCASAPVIVVTSSDAPRDRERACALGAARYFRKPADLMEFLQLGAVIRDVAMERGLPVGV